MNSRMHSMLAGAALVCCAIPAFAQDRFREHEFGRGEPPMRLDQRHHHDHYYRARGYAFGAVPQGSVRVGYRGGDWYFHGGVWFRPDGGRFVVSAPPIGIVVPLLPPDYATVTVAGAPYFYANGTYYVQAPGQGYAVVEPPPGGEADEPSGAAYAPAGQNAPGPYAPPPPNGPAGYVPAPAPAAAASRHGEPIVYPRNGQPSGQVDADRTACFRWATQNSVGADAETYQRAFGACMDGRGYSVR